MITPNNFITVFSHYRVIKWKHIFKNGKNADPKGIREIEALICLKASLINPDVPTNILCMPKTLDRHDDMLHIIHIKINSFLSSERMCVYELHNEDSLPISHEISPLLWNTDFKSLEYRNFGYSRISLLIKWKPLHNFIHKCTLVWRRYLQLIKNPWKIKELRCWHR